MRGGGLQLHVVVHFASRECWAAWSQIPAVRPLLEDARQRATGALAVQLADGFTGWFDLAAVPVSAPPPKWKMAVITWFVLFPILALVLSATEPWMSDAHPVARLLVITLIIVPLPTWFEMPAMNRAFQRWLHAPRSR